tara:strand:- start:752 stop:1006 length:255 start_codon:yes stop_codon:yes gene_type:complete
MAKTKKPISKPRNQPSKEKMVEAIVGLENGMDFCLKKVKQIEDILIKYVQFKKDDVEFQAYLTDIEKKIEENVANATNNPKNEE